MTQRLLVKICGLSTPETMRAAIDAGADMVGLVFHRKSPRSVSLEKAAELAEIARGRATIVALTVDPSDEGLNAITGTVRPDLLQLHGAETLERIAEIRRRWALPVMKAVGIADEGDLDRALHYRDAVEHLLLDAKPPTDAAYPGGHGQTFDWTALGALPADFSFLLSGGLNIGNVADALAAMRGQGLDLAGIDLSSGVETAPGIKDAGLIRAFMSAVRPA